MILHGVKFISVGAIGSAVRFFRSSFASALPALPVNAGAIAATGIMNFLLGDRWIFAHGRASRAGSTQSVTGLFERGSQGILGQRGDERANHPTQPGGNVA